ncbi:MAG: PAS domain S-box protein [Deltaproteobacteria bacterium]|nr:PAS domain S-box protein [Deltaproteobacteria bacterium]
MKDSEANYHTIFNAVNDAIAVVDLETGNFLDVNQKWCQMTGYSPEEARGLNVAALCLDEPPYTGADAIRWITEASREKAQLFEFMARTKEGRRHWVEINLRCAVIGGRERLLTVIRDISERKQGDEAMRTSEAKYRNLVEQIPAITYIAGLDDVSTPLYISPQIEAILGFTPEEWLADPEMYKNRIHPEDRDRVLTELILSYARGGPFAAEYRMLSKTGRVVWFRDQSRAVYDSEGRPLFMQGVALDITKHKKAEEDLRESETRFRAVFEGAPIGMALVDLHRTVQQANPALQQMIGYSEAEIRRLPAQDISHPDDWDADRSLFTELVAGKRNCYQLEKRYRHKQGHWVWVRLSVSLVRDAANRPQFAIGMMEDITERRRAQEATEEIKRQQEAILSNIGDLAWLKDRESRFIVVNETMARACGIAPGDLVGKTDMDTWPREVALKYLEDDREVMRTGKRKRLEELMADGEGNLVWVETIKTPIFNDRREVIGTAGTARDISERRRMEEALRKVSRALKAVTECHQAMLRATNEAELLSEICRIIVEVGGYRMAWVGFARPDEEKSVQPMAQQGFEDGYVQTLRVSWADTEWGRGPVGTAIRTGKPAISRDTQTDPQFAPWREEACKRGYASVLGLPLADYQTFGTLAIYATEVNAFDDEEINLLIGLANDLAYGIKALRAGAERQRVEEALRQSEQKYRSLMDGASDAIVLVDSRRTITEANQRAEDLLGYSEEELLGMTYPQIHPPEKIDHVLENFEEILTTGSGPLHECVIRRKDGQTVPVEIAHIMVGSGDNQVIQAVFRDVTERKRAGEALRDSEQKLRLLASQLLTVQEKERRRVSRELHDELGQALTVLKIHLVAIENKLRRDQPGLKLNCERLLGYIDAVIENVRRLSWDLSPSILEDLGLSSSLKYLVQEICRDNNMHYSVAVDEIDNLFSPEVKINIYRIFQESLTNIVRYAQAGRINVEIKKQQDRVTFLLRDNGMGFDVKEARSRNLDKRGLGLTTMHERALMAGGTLSVSSHKGQGTDVILTIPLQG